MSEAFTDVIHHRAAEAEAPDSGAGRHRGPVARDDGAAHEPVGGPGRHRRSREQSGMFAHAAEA